jgi:hypothetical protein
MESSTDFRLMQVLPLDESPAAGNGGLSSALSLTQFGIRVGMQILPEKQTARV